MSDVTAIVLSARPVALEVQGVEVLGRIQVLASAADLHAARLSALDAVRTPLCFFLDDDDELPADYLSVLDECADRMRDMGAALAYTDEILREPGKADVRRSWYEYDRDRHANAPLALHHLVLMDTAAAQAAARTLPRGEFWTEHMLYWAMAEDGAVYVPRVGYIWNRNPDGFSRRPQMLTAMVFGQRWINQQGASA